MPEWNFFAFDSKRVAQSILLPAENAIRNHDLSAWQAIYEKLNKCQFPPQADGSAWGGTLIENLASRPDALSRDTIPDEESFALRRTLQTFVELVSRHHLVSHTLRPRTWVMGSVDWKTVLMSRAESEELERFKAEIIPAQKSPRDPFWCLASNDAADANYVAPEVVANFAALEAKTGFLRSIPTRPIFSDELKGLGRDLAAAGLLIELAANTGLALYFREDGT